MSLQTRLSALVSAIGTDIKTLTTGVAQAEKRAVLVPDTDGTLDESSAVVWKRTSDGAYVAYTKTEQVGASASPNRSYVKTDNVDSEGTGYAISRAQASGLVGGNRRAAQLQLTGSSTERSVKAFAETDSGGVHVKKIVDNAGRSDFIQKGTRLDVVNQSANLTLISGIDGDTDHLWEIVIAGKLTPNGATGRYVSVLPNNWTGAISPYHRNWRNQDASTGHDVGVATDNGCIAGRSDFSNDEGNLLSRVIIATKAGGKRTYSTDWTYTSGSLFATLRGIAGGSYYGAAGQENTPVTSFVVNFNLQIFTGVITVKTLL